MTLWGHGPNFNVSKGKNDIIIINECVALHSPYQDSSLLGTCIIISVHFAVKLGSPEIFNDKIDVGVDLTDQIKVFIY